MIEITKITDVKQYIEGLRAVVFDLDDTLYGEKEYVRSGFSAVAKILPQVKEIENKLWKAFEDKKPALDEVLRTEGIYTDELKQTCLKVYRYQRPDIHVYDGVEDLLSYIGYQGVKTGIITDGRSESQRAKIRALGLERYMNQIIVTDELGGIEFRKPCEKAFQLMSDLLHIEYRKICYVGDNINKDFIAPQKLGIRSIWFRNQDGLYYKGQP